MQGQINGISKVKGNFDFCTFNLSQMKQSNLFYGGFLMTFIAQKGCMGGICVDA